MTAKPPAYRGYHIQYDPPPIPIRNADWQFHHDDYDGAEDSRDPRCGFAASEAECREQIDWIEDEL